MRRRVNLNQRNMTMQFFNFARYIRKYSGRLKVVVGQQELTMLDPNEETISIFQVHVMDRYNSTNQINDVALLQVKQ